MPLRIANCHAKCRAEDGAIVGFVVTVLVDPQFGVTVLDPTAEPRWGAGTVLVIHLDENGGPINATL